MHDWDKSPPFVTSNSGGGQYEVSIKVHSMDELHAAHDLVLKAFSDARAVDTIIDAAIGGAERFAPKVVSVGASPPLFDGMQADNDGPWVSRVDVAKRLRTALTGA